MATLGEQSIGSVVKVNVGGAAKEFIVVNQGKPSTIYDDSCAGTWLLMKDIHENREWHSSNVNDYANSTIHAYLNSAFLNLFDTDIRLAVKQVKIPYRPGSGTSSSVNSGANGLATKIFLLSAREIGWTSTDNPYIIGDGDKLAFFSYGNSAEACNKRIAYLNSIAKTWHSRSPWTVESTRVVYIDGSTSPGATYCTSPNGIRPAFIFPSTMYVLKDGSVSSIFPPALYIKQNGAWVKASRL